jgi:hypothetical protein
MEPKKLKNFVILTKKERQEKKNKNVTVDLGKRVK